MLFSASELSYLCIIVVKLINVETVGHNLQSELQVCLMLIREEIW